MDAEKISEFVLDMSGFDRILVNIPSVDLMNDDVQEEQLDEY